MVNLIDQPVGIISVGIGNVESISSMLNALGKKNYLITNPLYLNDFNKIILPGVGNFGAFMTAINNLGFYDALKDYSSMNERKILGLCVGAQVMLQSSEESPNVPGFGWLKGTNILVKSHKTKIVPRIGWDYLEVVSGVYDKDMKISLNPPNKFYFAHSYKFQLENSQSIVAMSRVDNSIPAVFLKDNIMGAQFHPEKSNKSGFRFLEMFLYGAQNDT